MPLALAAIFVAVMLWWQFHRRGSLTGQSLRVVLHLGALLPSLLFLAVGLLLSLYYADAAQQTTWNETQERFGRQAEQLESSLLEQVNHLDQSLDSVRSLLLLNPGLSRAEFANYVASRDKRLVNPGIQGLGIVERVARSDLDAFVARQRRQDWPDFKVSTAGAQADLLVIRALEPAAHNLPAIGYDLGSETLRRSAMEQAMRSGLPVLSQRVQLLQDEHRRPAFLLILPVYSGASVPQDEAARARSLQRWVFAPIVLSDFIAGTKGLDVQMANFQLFDKPELDAASLVYDSELPSGELRAPQSLERARHSVFSLLRPVLVADQVLYLRSNSTPAFEAQYHARDHLKIAALGSGLSVLAAMLLWSLLAGRARAVEVARSITQDLERLAMVAQRTSNAVFFADTDWRITWVNEGFTRMSGYTAQDALGRKPSALLHGPNTEPSVHHYIDRQMEAGRLVKTLVQQRNKAGQDYWVELEVIPVRRSDGRVTAYLTVQTDMTEVVRAKAELMLEKEQAQNILTGTNVGTWESNLLTGEQRWNERWGAMMGFAREEVLPACDQFWQQRLHPIDRDRLNQAMASCLAGHSDSYSCAVRVQRKDGSWMWILSRAKIMSRTEDGRVEWLGGIHTDITEIKQVEINLREMEAFLDRAGRIAGVGAWQLDLRSRELVFSAQTCALHGMAADFRPTEREALSYYPAADRRRLVDAMRRAELEGTPMDLVVEFTTAQGQQLWVRIFGEVSFDDNGPVYMAGAFQDVTKDHQAQQEVERSGELLRGAIEAINEAFVLYDPQDRLVFCNDKYRAMYDKTSDLMLPGVRFETLVRAGAERGQYLDALGRVEEWVEERMAAHRSGHLSMEQRLESGRWLKVVERRMADGHTVGFRMDITELKLATAAAESISARRGEEQKRLQSILEGTHVGTWEWNVRTGTSIYSEQYVGMLGYTLAELEPDGYDIWVRLAHPDDLVAAAQRMQEHLSGQRPEYEIEVRMLHKQGHWVWVLARGKLALRMEDGSPLWVYGTHMDITKRKLAEQELAQTSAMLQNVLDSATAVGVITLDLDHGIQVFNKGAENLLGYDAADLVGREKVDTFFDPTEVSAMRETLALMWGYQPALTEVFEHVLRVRDEQEWTLQRRDGSRFQTKLIFSPMHDVQGERVGSLGVLYDISRQKEYEATLREAMRLAEQSSLAKSQFLANMSHEIRTPMNAILGMLQLLRNTPLNSHQQDYTQKAAGAARSLLGLLNDILDFSKVEAGKMQLDSEPFLLDNLLGELSVILSSNLGGKNVDLVFDVDPAIPRELVGDALRLKQILINLGGNAVKFTEQGEVVIHCSLLSRTPERVRLMLAVVDSGIGIAPENQSRIFSAFTQAEANTTRRFGGTGLGLVISTRLIRLMGGELELTSALGRGSSFSFTLELGVAPPVHTPALPAPAREPQAGPQLRALVVDDNALALASSAALMRSLGWEVAEAANGAQALVWVKSDLESVAQPLDAVFVDWEMPDMDGWETLRQVRRLFGNAKPPLLIMLSRHSRSALSQRTEREQELLNGLMVKPLTAAMFAQTLAQAREGSPVLDHKPVSRSLRLAGMRVLLVEDNLINQQVAQELLSVEGAQVTLADNGELGVAAVRSAEPAFDVVLMDLQMPVMDGLSATRLLRADPRFAALPIIAMTANAMHSDREECLAAGMNEHVGKPFDVQALVQTLIRHTGWAGTRAGVAPPLAAVPASPEPAQQPWPEGIEVALALARMGGNKGLLQRSIQAFVADAQSLQQRLEHSLQGTDPAQAKRDLHAFKGLSATVGAPALSVLAAQAEKLLQAEGASARYQQVMAELQQRMAQLLPLLTQVALQLLPLASPVVEASDRAPSSRQLEPAALLQFRELLQALQRSDMEALELHAVLRQSLDETYADTLEPLDLAMSELEFESAAVECEKLVRQFETS